MRTPFIRLPPFPRRLATHCRSGREVDQEFSFYGARVLMLDTRSHQAATIAVDDAPRLPGGHVARVLVVEDEHVQSLLLQRLLQSHGHMICGVADTADAAVAIAKQRRPDIILMDVRLADGTDGIAAAKKIAKEQPCILIFVTGYPDGPNMARMNALSPAAIIAKPTLPEVIIKVIDEAAQRHIADLGNRNQEADPRYVSNMMDACVLSRVGGPEDAAVDRIIDLFQRGKMSVALHHSVKEKLKSSETPNDIKTRAALLVYSVRSVPTLTEERLIRATEAIVRADGAAKFDAGPLVEIAKYKGYFITTDAAIHKRVKELESLLGIVIVTPADFVKLYGRFEAR